jgi:hypothetical protein
VAGVLQLGLALHIRNTATAAAAEGSRTAARAWQSDGIGIERARRDLGRRHRGPGGSWSTAPPERRGERRRTADAARRGVGTFPAAAVIRPDRAVP